MRTIAIEEHFMANGFREAMQGNVSTGGASNAAFAGELQARLADLGEIRLIDMDVASIDLQVISQVALEIGSLPEEELIRLARQANDQLAAAIAAHPTRFAGFATLPMTSPEAAAEELERAVHMHGLKGAMISGTTNGHFLDDPAFLPVLERAVALDVPIYIHPGVPPAPVREIYYSGFDPAVNYVLATSAWGWHSETAIHALRLILSGIFDRLPNLQIIIGHMGEMIPFMFARINDRLAPLTKNLQHPVPDYFLRNFYITTSGFFTEPPFLLALQIMGADRIIFSVDYPYSPNERGRAFLDTLSISRADKEKISHLNAERVLKLGNVS
ncbi:MAG TPA: amidohydrolase family protein [Ktedonobacteraceae bacterium]|jgi:predicted TIM-barrel fold metal-dependent hydrolase|nr:amidohydrolase family protein [Ktedonobacteraceae bacterium]